MIIAKFFKKKGVPVTLLIPRELILTQQVVVKCFRSLFLALLIRPSTIGLS